MIIYFFNAWDLAQLCSSYITLSGQNGYVTIFTFSLVIFVALNNTLYLYFLVLTD